MLLLVWGVLTKTKLQRFLASKVTIDNSLKIRRYLLPA